MPLQFFRHFFFGGRRGKGGRVADEFGRAVGRVVEADLAEAGGFAAEAQGFRRRAAHRGAADDFDL